MAAGVEPAEGQGIRRQLDEHLEAKKQSLGVQEDTDLSWEDLKTICEEYKVMVRDLLGKPFPDNADTQIWGAIGAVFASWNGRRAGRL